MYIFLRSLHTSLTLIGQAALSFYKSLSVGDEDTPVPKRLLDIIADIQTKLKSWA